MMICWLVFLMLCCERNVRRNDVALTRTGIALGKPARLVPVPVSVRTTAAFVLGKSEISRRLWSSLQVDISKIGGCWARRHR